MKTKIIKKIIKYWIIPKNNDMEYSNRVFPSFVTVKKGKETVQIFSISTYDVYSKIMSNSSDIKHHTVKQKLVNK